MNAESQIGGGEESQRIWQLVDHLRHSGRGRPSMATVAAEAEARSLTLAWEDVHQLVIRLDRSYGSTVVPTYLAHLLNAYLMNKGHQVAFNPEARYGTLLTAFVKSGAVREGIGLTSDGELQVARIISRGLPIQWLSGIDTKGFEKVVERCDVVISNPPYAIPPYSMTFSSQGGDTAIRDSGTHLLHYRTEHVS